MLDVWRVFKRRALKKAALVGHFYRAPYFTTEALMVPLAPVQINPMPG
jgi:hypothetical protein